MKRYKINPTEKDAGIKALSKIITAIRSNFETENRTEIYSKPQIIYRGITKDYENCEVLGEWYIRSSLSIRFRKTMDQLHAKEKDITDIKNAYHNNPDKQKIKIAKYKQDIYNKHINKAEYLDQILTLISDAKRTHPERYLGKSDLEILSDIQHNGGATCLVDFSRNILTSLWFACNGDFEADGYLVCYNTTEDIIVNNSLTKLTEKEMKRPIKELLIKTSRIIDVCSVVNNRFCLWEPMSINSRISRQDSVFIFGIEQFKISDMSDQTVLLIRISKKLKKPICDLLESRFCINSETIYNDYVGYANSNGKCNVLYQNTEDCDNQYFQKGFNALIHGNYKESLELLNSIDINKTNIERQLEISFSRAVCYKNRGIGYSQNAILAYKDFITKTKELLERNNKHPNYIYYLRKTFRAYNEIVNICYKTYDWEMGYSICDKISALIQNNTPKCGQDKSNEIIDKNLCKNCLFKNTDSRQENNNCLIYKLSTRSITLIKMEFLVLRLLSECKNKLDKKTIDKYNKCIIDIYKNITDKSEFKPFDKFLAEYYKQVVDIITTGEYDKSIVNNTATCIPATTKDNSIELKKIGFYSWNFEDIKQTINQLTPKQISKSKKEKLQELTSTIITAKDIIQSKNYKLYYKI